MTTLTQDPVATSGEQTSLFIAPALTVSEEELETLLAALDHGLELADQEAAKGVGSRAPA